MTEIIKARKVKGMVASEETTRERVADPRSIFKEMIVNEKLEKHFPKNFEDLRKGFNKIFPPPTAKMKPKELKEKEKKTLHDFCNLYKESSEEKYVKLVENIINNEKMKSYLKEKGFFSSVVENLKKVVGGKSKS